MTISKFLCIFIVFSLLLRTQLIESKSISPYCFPNRGYSPRSLYRDNLNSLLSTLQSRSSSTGFYNHTVGFSPDRVYGMFLCRGDVSLQDCQDCITSAAQEVIQNCTYQKEAIIWYAECMLRYSDLRFFSIFEKTVYAYRRKNVLAPGAFTRFQQELSNQTDSLIRNASFGSSSDFSSSSLLSTRYFAQGKHRVYDLYETYDLNTLAQCTPDLSLIDCNSCLKSVLALFTECCYGNEAALIFTPNCLLKYEVSDLPSPPPPPFAFYNRPSSSSLGNGFPNFALYSVGVIVALILASLCICFRRGMFNAAAHNGAQANRTNTGQNQSVPMGNIVNQNPGTIKSNQHANGL